MFPHVPVIRRPGYTVSLEHLPSSPLGAFPQTYVHCSFTEPWTKDARERFRGDFEALFRLHGGPLYVLKEPDDNKLLKFITLFGFDFHKAVICYDGTEGHVFIRE